MNVPFARLHRDSAVALFRQRQGWQAQDETAAVALGRLERRLRLHLHVLARCGDEDPVPEKAPETFVHLAARLDAPDEGRRTEGVRTACALLAEGGPQGEGACAALALLAPQEADGSLLELYRTDEGLRSTLFRLWRDQGSAVPSALLARDELRRGTVALQLAALEYAAESPVVGPELFRSYYQPYLGAASTPVPGALLAAALWGGMVRGDREANRALRRAIALETGDGDGALLRLAALGGDAALLPVLHRRLETDPVQGAWLLALHGSAGAIAMLLEALKQPSTKTAVAAVWPWVSGSVLPVVPRLRLVGEEARESAVTLPDAQAAIRWWEAHRNEGAGRWIAGVALSSAHLADLAGRKAGQAGRDLLDLLALQLGRPLGISASAEQARRRSALHKALSQAPPGVVAQIRPGVSRHV